MKQEKQVPLAQPSAKQTQPQIAEQVLSQVRAQAGAEKATQEKRFDRKKWLMLLALVFFLFSIIFIVPVGSLPGLRNLAWWMGFSAQQTQSMSFGRALLTWAGEGTRLLSSKRNTEQEISLFDRKNAQTYKLGSYSTGLFDVDAINAERRKRGLGSEGLSGVYTGLAERDGALNRKVNDFSQEARQNEAAKNMQEVYFGADANLMARSAQTASMRKGVLDAAKLLPKGAVVGSISPDWFALAVDKAAKLSNEQLNQAIGISTTVAPLSSLNAQVKSKSKPQRDLAQIWLMSKASNRAKQLMLKKQLAAAGYIGMEMPKKVYDSLGLSSGVMMGGEDLVKDLEDVQMQLLKEEQCRTIGAEANGVMMEKMEQSINLVNTITTTVPRTCDADVAGWSQSLSEVSSNCNTVKNTIKTMSENCGSVKLSKEGTCTTERLNTYANDFTQSCQALTVAQAEYESALDAYNKAKAEYDAAVASAPEGTSVDDSALKAAEQKLKDSEKKKDQAEDKVDDVKDGLKDSEVFDTFNISSGAQQGGSGNFFPEFGDSMSL